MSGKEISDGIEFPWTLRRRQLGHMLKTFREFRGETRQAVQEKLLEALARHKGEPGWDGFRRIVDPQCGGSLAALESSSATDETITLPDIEPLSSAYMINPLMFDPLLSKSVRDVFLLHRHTNDFERVDKKGTTHYGEGITYWVPKTKLEGTEPVAILYLELAPNARSASHYHQGDEILYVEEGSVELWLENTGLRIKLERGDLTHFDAGQLHSACNRSNEIAKVFLIRFSPLRFGTRVQLFEELAAVRPSENVVTRLIKEMRASDWTNTRQEFNEEAEVLDRYGLGRFLQLLCSEHFLCEGLAGLSLDDLAKRSENKGYKYKRSKFARLHHGETQVIKEDLPKLADIYDVRPMLLYDYLFPAYRYAVVVREDEMKRIGPGFGVPEGATYKVPCRRLAYSDITLALVKLEPGASTSENRHPGFELLKPLEGEVALEFGGSARPFPVKKSEYIYFHSNVYHRVRNQREIPATVLVIRFLE